MMSRGVASPGSSCLRCLAPSSSCCVIYSEKLCISKHWPLSSDSDTDQVAALHQAAWRFAHHDGPWRGNSGQLVLAVSGAMTVLWCGNPWRLRISMHRLLSSANDPEQNTALHVMMCSCSRTMMGLGAAILGSSCLWATSGPSAILTMSRASWLSFLCALCVPHVLCALRGLDVPCAVYVLCVPRALCVLRVLGVLGPPSSSRMRPPVKVQHCHACKDESLWPHANATACVSSIACPSTSLAQHARR